MSKVIIVTGANQGIGFELVRQLAKAGNTVYLGARSADKGTEAVSKLHGEGLSTVKLLVIDVTSQESVNSALKTFSAANDRLDILINNAGISMEGNGLGPADITVDIVKETYEVNVFGVIRTTTAFLPLIKKSSQPILLTVSSGLGSTTLMTTKENNPFYGAQHPAYNSSKAAINAYTAALSTALPQARVNVICPGYVATNINKYSGVLTPTQSVEGIIKVGLDFNGPTGTFLSYDGKTYQW